MLLKGAARAWTKRARASPDHTNNLLATLTMELVEQPVPVVSHLIALIFSNN